MSEMLDTWRCVECPVCGATAGRPCESDGAPIEDGAHTERALVGGATERAERAEKSLDRLWTEATVREKQLKNLRLDQSRKRTTIRRLRAALAKATGGKKRRAA